jgi:hypothetical protein
MWPIKHFEYCRFVACLSMVVIFVEICSLRYPTRFVLIAHFKISGFKAKKRGKKMVLNVWLGAHLQEIHCCCQQKVCSVNGLIMGDVRSTKDTTPSRTS